MARSYDVKLTLEVQPISAEGEPPRRPWITRQEYPDMDYEQVVNVEEAVIEALLGLGRAAVATRKAAV